MKKLFTLICAASLLAACSSTNDTLQPTPNLPEDEVDALVSSLYTQEFSNGATMTIGSSKDIRAIRAGRRLSREAADISVTPAEPLDASEMSHLSEAFFAEFPAGKRNLEVSHSSLEDFSYDFDMVADGQPFSIYPVLVGGDARNILGISYLNGEEYVDVDIIDLTDDSVIGNAQNGWSCIQDGQGVTVQLPRGTRYQFYIRNSHAQGTPLHGQPFYSAADRNYHEQAHAVTFIYDNCNFVGFEDLDLEAKRGVDFDYNDLILKITPRQKVLRSLTLDIPLDLDKSLACAVDDFALSNNVERYPEHYNIGDDPNRKIFIDRYSELCLQITDFDNLTFNEEYNEWTYETWVWLKDPVELAEGQDGIYVIGKEDEPDYSYSKDNYKIGVSAYLGNESDNTVGYVKISVHISLKDE